MRKRFIYFTLYSLIFAVLCTAIPGFIYTGSFFAGLVYGLFWAIGLKLLGLVLRFFLVPDNFITQLIFVGLFSAGYLYMLDFGAPGIQLLESEISSFETEYFVFSGLHLLKYQTIIVSALIMSICSSYIRFLTKK